MVGVRDEDGEEDVEEGEVGNGTCATVAMGLGTMQAEDRNKYFMRKGRRGLGKEGTLGVTRRQEGLIYME